MTPSLTLWLLVWLTEYGFLTVSLTLWLPSCLLLALIPPMIQPKLTPTAGRTVEDIFLAWARNIWSWVEGRARPIWSWLEVVAIASTIGRSRHWSLGANPLILNRNDYQMVDLIKSPLCYCATLKWIIHFVPVNKVRLLLTGGGGRDYLKLDQEGARPIWSWIRGGATLISSRKWKPRTELVQFQLLGPLP